MKSTIDNLIGLVTLGGMAVSAYIIGYYTAENKHLAGDIKIMSMLTDLIVKTHETIDKNENNKEETEE